MDGTARFLLGGAIGAALGYLLSQKNLQKAALEGAPGVVETVPVREAMAPIPTQESAAPSAPTFVAAVSAPEAPAMVAPVVESPYEPPMAEVPLELPVTESPFEPPAAASVLEAAIVETPVAAAPVEEAPVEEVSPDVEEVTPPPPTSWGEWEPLEVVETPLEPPVVEDVTPPPPPPPAPQWEAEPAPVAVAPVIEAPEVPVEIEETEISFTKDFLDQPVSAPGWISTVPMVDEEDMGTVLPVVPDEFPPMEAAEIERMPVMGGTAWEGTSRSEQVAEVGEIETAAEAAIIESLDYQTPVVEVPFLDDVIVETPVADVTLVEEETLVEEQTLEAPPETMDDLKARIEETRRRIRQELEQPFISGAPSPVAAVDDWTVSPVVPVAEPVAPPSPQVQEVVEAALDDEDYGVEEVVFGEPVDYDSMKSRIEDVRSRLKAKAFDAMMSGESALLGRDSDDVQRPRVVPEVDTEVDETIESSLREEDN